MTTTRYVTTSPPPTHTHSLAPFSVIFNPDGAVRLIHDGSQQEVGQHEQLCYIDVSHRSQTVDL